MWIIKLTGGFMVILSLGVMGMNSAFSLKKRVAFINRIILSIDKISQFIKIGNDEKEEILKNALPKGIFYENEWVQTEKSTALKAEDKRLFEEFLIGLGMSDGEAEIIRCQAFKNLFKKQLNDAEREEKEKYKLFSLGGFLTGIIITFLWW